MDIAVRYVPRIGASQSCIAPKLKPVAYRIASRIVRRRTQSSHQHRIASHRIGDCTVPHRSRKRIACIAHALPQYSRGQSTHQHRHRTAASHRARAWHRNASAPCNQHGESRARISARVHRHRISTHASKTTHVPHRTHASRTASKVSARHVIDRAGIVPVRSTKPRHHPFQARQQRTRYHRGIIAGT
jgi:hypothetical protein